MKVYKNFGQVVAKLKQHGFGENSVMISRCGLPDEQISYNLDEVDPTSVNYLSTILAKKRKLG
jgi:precorrin-2/cobalt-factor-2 C20-methyltransferase